MIHMKMSPFMLLCSAGLFAIFSSTISKSPVLPLFATYLGADPSGVGFIASVSAFTGVVVSVPAGILSDRIGRRKMLLFSSVIFATAPFLYPLVTNLWQLAAIRFYHGLATAIFVPVAMALVSELYHKERGEKMGWFSTSTLVGRFMAPVAGGTIIGALALNQGLSYTVVYIVCGVAGLIALLLAFRIKDSVHAGHSGRRWQETFSEFRTIICNRDIIATSAVEASILFAYGTFETFLPLSAVSSGITVSAIGICLSSQVITLALTKPLMGRFSDRHGRSPQIVAGALTGAVSIAGFSLVQSFLPLLLLSILFGLSLSIVTSATSALIADMSREAARGSAMGVLGSIMDIGHTTGPLVSGFIAASFGYGRSFLGASGILALAALLFWANFRKGTRRTTETQGRSI